MLVDLTAKGVSGKDAQEVLDRAGITVNKNGIPFDTQGPMITSGIRVGTPALTTRGMKETDMKVIARLIAEVLTISMMRERSRQSERKSGPFVKNFHSIASA